MDEEDPTTLEECEERLAILNMRLADVMEEQIALAKEFRDKDMKLSDKYWYLLAEITRIDNIKETFL